MSRHKITRTNLEGVLLIESPVHNDERGIFREVYRKSELEEVLGYELDIAQANHSLTKHNTVRGIHIAPWDKIVTCVSGMVQQVVVDTRRYSSTFGENFSTLMCVQDGKSVYIPEGCGNAFLALKDANYVYNTTDEWETDREISLLWNDPELNIQWDLPHPKPGKRDASNMSFAEYKEKVLKI